MAAIPKHLRDNHENTDAVLTDLRGLAFAFEALHEAHEAPAPVSNEALAKITVLRLMIAQFEVLNTMRSLEWAGIGGSHSDLTPEQIAAARDESQE